MLDCKEQQHDVSQLAEVDLMPASKADSKPRSDQPKPSEQHEGVPGLFDPSGLPTPAANPKHRVPNQPSEKNDEKKPPAIKTAGGV